VPQEILKQFCDRKTIPVNVGEIEAAVRRRVMIDQINFYPSPTMDSSIVRGTVDRIHGICWHPPRDGGFADIYYPDGMDPDWQRLVQTKELVQLLDSAEGMAIDRERIEKLITELVTPREVSAISNPTKEDHYALTWALAWLFPRKCRDLLREPFAEGKITAPEIAAIAKIPGRFIPFLFSDAFGKWLDAILEEDGN